MSASLESVFERLELPEGIGKALSQRWVGAEPPSGKVFIMPPEPWTNKNGPYDLSVRLEENETIEQVILASQSNDDVPARYRPELDYALYVREHGEESIKQHHIALHGGLFLITGPAGKPKSSLQCCAEVMCRNVRKFKNGVFHPDWALDFPMSVQRVFVPDADPTAAWLLCGLLHNEDFGDWFCKAGEHYRLEELEDVFRTAALASEWGCTEALKMQFAGVVANFADLRRTDFESGEPGSWDSNRECSEQDCLENRDPTVTAMSMLAAIAKAFGMEAHFNHFTRRLILDYVAADWDQMKHERRRTVEDFLDKDHKELLDRHSARSIPMPDFSHPASRITGVLNTLQCKYRMAILEELQQGKGQCRNTYECITMPHADQAEEHLFNRLDSDWSMQPIRLILQTLFQGEGINECADEWMKMVALRLYKSFTGMCLENHRLTMKTRRGEKLEEWEDEDCCLCPGLSKAMGADSLMPPAHQ